MTLTDDEEREAARADHAFDEARDRDLERQLETRDVLAGITVRITRVAPVADESDMWDADFTTRWGDWTRTFGGATVARAPIGGALTVLQIDEDTLRATRERFGREPERHDDALARLGRLIAGGVERRLAP